MRRDDTVEFIIYNDSVIEVLTEIMNMFHQGTWKQKQWIIFNCYILKNFSDW